MGKGDKKDNKGSFKGQLGQSQFISFSDVISSNQGHSTSGDASTSSSSLNYNQNTSSTLLLSSGNKFLNILFNSSIS